MKKSNVVGIAPAAVIENWQLKVDALKAMRLAKMTVPRELEVELGLEPGSIDDPKPQPTEREVELQGAVFDWTDGERSGVQILLHELPDDVKTIRIYSADSSAAPPTTPPPPSTAPPEPPSAADGGWGT